MTLDTQHPSTTSAAGPTGYYSGLPRLAQGHSSPRLDHHHPYPYLYQNSVPGSFNSTNPSGNPSGTPNGNINGNGNVDNNNNSNSLIQNTSTPLNLPMNPPVSMNNPSTSIPMSNLMNSSMMNSIQSRTNHNETNHSHLNNTNNNNSLSNNNSLPIPFPTSLRSNSWDGQAMVPYQWGLPSQFHDRHRASQPDIGQVPSSSMPFQSQFTANYNPNFHQLNFDQQMYPQSNMNDIPNSNVQLPFPSNRFAYPDGRPYSVLGNSTAGFAYGKPYDKPTSPRGLTMFGEPAFTDRPHLCQIPNCGRMFKRLEHLKRHHRSIHTHERPYPCRYPKCSKAFSRSDNLAQHMRIHRQDPHTDL